MLARTMRVSGGIDRMASDAITSQARLSANRGRSRDATSDRVEHQGREGQQMSMPAEITRVDPAAVVAGHEAEEPAEEQADDDRRWPRSASDMRPP